MAGCSITFEKALNSYRQFSKTRPNSRVNISTSFEHKTLPISAADLLLSPLKCQKILGYSEQLKTDKRITKLNEVYFSTLRLTVCQIKFKSYLNSSYTAKIKKE